jgi:hypothetical protein
MPKVVYVVAFAIVAIACEESPVGPTSVPNHRSVSLAETLSVLVTDSDPPCDPSYAHRCLKYAVTASRAGVLEVAITWTPKVSLSTEDQLGFSVVAPSGRHSYPVDSGITRRVRVQASPRDVFRVNVWALSGEEFQLQTSLQ